MPRHGKAKSSLAPMQDIIRNLQLDEDEGPRFTASTYDFLAKTKKLQDIDLLDTSETTFHKLAREFLEKVTTPGKGPTWSQYWPIDDDFKKTLTYEADPTKIIKLVGYIMRVQRETLLEKRDRRRRRNAKRVEYHGSICEPGPSVEMDAGSPTDDEPVDEENEALTEASRQCSEFPSAIEIIRTARDASATANPVNSTAASSHLATPPITPAVPSTMQRRPLSHDDSPHPSIETANTIFTASETATPRRSLQPEVDRRNRRRERSPTVSAEYNPRLPTHRDGTFDESSIKSWDDGVKYVKEKIKEFNQDLRGQLWEHPMITTRDEHAAVQIIYKSSGLVEFIEFLDKDLQKQQKRRDEFKASKAAPGTSERGGVSRIDSP